MDDNVIDEFLVESYEGLNQMEADLVALEREPSDLKKLASVFRAIHTIKGTCGFFGFVKLESVSHAGENLLSRLRGADLALDAEIASALLALVDAVREILNQIERTRAEGDRDFAPLIERLTRLQRLDGPSAATDKPPTPSASAPTPPTSEAGGPPAGTLGGGLLDPLIEKGRLDPEAVMLAAQQQRLGDPRRIGEILVDHGALKPQDILEALITRGEAPTSAITEANIRVDVHLLDLLMNLVGELVLARNQLLQYVPAQSHAALAATTQRLSLITTELQEGIMKTRMQPVANLCNKLPRLVRDLAAACGKEVELELEGAETELDRTIIEAIRDPLTHLVRNAVDHGIEPREVRLALGKRPQGRLLLRAYHEGGKVILEVSDDGGGLPLERIRETALRGNLVPSERVPRMADRDWYGLIFLPGFSTAEKVTNVSGRGVGMDVVKINVERIGGAIEVDSVPGGGTTMRIRIPLTLAIIPALIVGVGGERYAIPQVNLLELVRAEGDFGHGALAKVYDVQVYRYRDRLLPLVFLHDALQVDAPVRVSLTSEGRAALNIVVLHADGITFGLVVDEIRTSQEIVVKPLAEPIRRNGVFSGATILGDGRVALILDVPGLARHQGIAPTAEEETRPAPASSPEDPRAMTQTLVTFRVRENWNVAVPLSAVARLEEFPPSVVEQVGDRQVVQYRGGILPLHPLLRLLDPTAASPSPRAGDVLRVVVHGHGAGSVGLMVEEIQEIVEETFTLQEVQGRPGVLGSAVIRGKVTDWVDLPLLLQSAGVAPVGPAPGPPAGGA